MSHGSEAPKTTVAKARPLYRNVIDLPRAHPARKDVRYSLNTVMLGKLERLSRARFVVGGLDADLVAEWKRSEDSERALVQSVYASSEIEGEGVVMDDLPIDLAAVTEAVRKAADPELQKRLDAVRSITEAGLWAFSLDKRGFLDFDFVVELHRRMFESTKPRHAGRIKTTPNVVRGGRYHIEMLPPRRRSSSTRCACGQTAPWSPPPSTPRRHRS